MRFLLTSACKDFRRRAADPFALLIWIAFPVLLGTLISLLGGNDGPAPTAHVLVADQDDSVVSNMLLGAARQGTENELVSIEEVALDAGQTRIGEGDGTALLIVPRGFGTALLNDEPTELELVTNPAERILPAIVIEGLEVFGEAAFYGQRLLGEPVRTLADGPQPGDDFVESAVIAEIAARINDRLIEAGSMLSSPMLELDLDDDAATEDANGAGAFDFARFILPGILFMSILFIAQGLSEDFWTEKAAGTLRRAVDVPHSLAIFVGGKLLAGLVLIGLVAIVALGMGSLTFGVPLVRAALAVLWCAYAGMALLCLFLLIAIMCTSRRAANVTSTVILFPLMMLGGSFLPFEAMPEWMRAIGVWTPNGIAVVELRDLLFGSTDPASLASAIAAIAATLGLTLFLSVRRLNVFVTS